MDIVLHEAFGNIQQHYFGKQENVQGTFIFIFGFEIFGKGKNH